MFRSLGRLLIVCFRLVGSCFQLFARFGCSPFHHQDYQQHNNDLTINNNNATTNSGARSSSNTNLHQQSIQTTTTLKYQSNGFRLNGLNHHQQQQQQQQNGHYKRSKSFSQRHQNNINNHNNNNNNFTAIGYLNNKIYTDKDDPFQQAHIRPIIPFHMLIINYICHGTLWIFGHLNDFLRQVGWLESLDRVEKNRDGYVPLYRTFEPFYIRNIIQRLINMWSHPICGAPGAYTDILEREFTSYNASWKFTGKVIRTINMGSYDYLGHSENSGPRIDSVCDTIKQLGVSVGSTPNELGTTKIYRDLEEKVARFLGVEDSVVIGMGFATNSLSLPSLFGAGSLVLSDECNHASLALGCKTSGAKICRFKHNDMNDLEKIIRKNLWKGQPKNGQPWKKIVILVEGIYSMEGTIVNLPKLIELKKKYKAYVYMDEAHSIGAMGERGRGICDYYNCDPHDIDLLMGTFTKSFAAAGGYIAGKKYIIDYIRTNSAAFYYGTTMAPPICQQISLILDDFLALDDDTNNSIGKMQLQNRIRQLRRNVLRFRQKLKQMGFHIDGNDDSPVVPLMVYSPTHLKCLIFKLLKKGVASTGASFPVTKLTGPRARFCLSAGHSDEMIDHALQCLDEIGTEIGIKFNETKFRNDDKQQSNALSNNTYHHLNNRINSKSQMHSNIVF